MRLPLLLAGALAALLAGALVALGLAVTAGQAPVAAPRESSGPTPTAAATPGPPMAAIAALTRWDAGRARAWASADPAALASLYAAGSVAGRRDVRMLQGRWRDRGLRVERMRTQLISVEVEDREAGRWDLLVTDRLVGGVAVGRGLRADLPVDRPSRRRVTLLLDGGRWQVASVLPHP